MPKVQPLKLNESDNICDYVPLGPSKPFVYSDLINGDKKDIESRLNNQAPANTTHYDICTCCGEPYLLYGEICHIQYFKKRVL